MAHSTVTTELVTYNGWNDCIRMDNGKIQLIVTTEVGPRIIHFARKNGSNMMWQSKDDQGQKYGDGWRMYGGHRLWHSPQVGTRPNQPDNDPVKYEINGATVKLTAEAEKATGLQKAFEITMHANEPCVTVNHFLINRSLWPIEMAAWPLTVLVGSGTAVLPVPRNETPDYLPNFMISFWPWMKPNDPRFDIGDKTITVKHDKTNAKWFKIGVHNPPAWGAYISENNLFVKTMQYDPRATYPDFGANFEVFADNQFLELETLSPLQTVAPGDRIEHAEEWVLLECDPALGPDGIEEIARPYIRKAR